jgi:hypothetical protein
VFICSFQCVVQPVPDSRDVRQAIAGATRPGADLDRDAADPVHLGKAVFVIQVIADEHRMAAAKGRFRKIFGHRRALVDARRLDFYHALALLQFQPATRFLHQPRHQSMRVGGQMGRLPVVQGERQALVLQQQAGMASQHRCQRLLEGAFGAGWRGMDPQPAGGVASLQTMLAGQRHALCAQQFFQIGDRAAADQGQGAAADAGQPSDQFKQFQVHPHGRRRVGDFEQRAIDIEEEGALGTGAGGRRRDPSLIRLSHLPCRSAGRAGAWRRHRAACGRPSGRR